MTTIYGIKNCDTMKKAMRWLEQHGGDWTFHDYKKQGVDEAVLRQALEEHGWETVINRRGTTWRQLPDAVKDVMDKEGAMRIAVENPSIIKRPLLSHQGQTYIGFQDDLYQTIFQ